MGGCPMYIPLPVVTIQKYRRNSRCLGVDQPSECGLTVTEMSQRGGRKARARLVVMARTRWSPIRISPCPSLLEKAESWLFRYLPLGNCQTCPPGLPGVILCRKRRHLYSYRPACSAGRKAIDRWVMPGKTGRSSARSQKNGAAGFDFNSPQEFYRGSRLTPVWWCQSNV